MRRMLLGVVLLALGACSSDDGAGSLKPHADAGADADAASDASDAAAEAEAADAPDAESPPKVLLPKTGLEPAELAVLINESDPQSVEVAAYYQDKRGIPATNLVKLSFAVNDVMTESDFATAKALVDALPPTIQGLVVTWTRPYRVECMSTTSAFALGFDKKYCNMTGGCGPTAAIEYEDTDSVAPFTDYAIRPAMMLAAKDAAGAKALVDRGIAADDTFPTGDGWLVRTTDAARSVRWTQFVKVTQDFAHPEEMKLTYVDNSAGSGDDSIKNHSDVLFYFTGLVTVPDIATNTYRAGAVADHLTSFGGQVPTSGQMSVVAWLEAGVTASYGTVVEPCNYTSKFPDPRSLIPRYYRGATVLEAYWKSVIAPGEGLFVGEPLARPWGKSIVTWQNGTLGILTTMLDPAHTYAVESAESEAGPFTPVSTGISVAYHRRFQIDVPNATSPVYRLVQEP